MNMSIIKSFSLFVASGNGDRCNTMISILRHNMIAIDQKTGLSVVHLHKNCKDDPKYKEDHVRISRNLGKLVVPMLRDIPEEFYTSGELNIQRIKN